MEVGSRRCDDILCHFFLHYQARKGDDTAVFECATEVRSVVERDFLVAGVLLLFSLLLLCLLSPASCQDFSSRRTCAVSSQSEYSNIPKINPKNARRKRHARGAHAPHASRQVVTNLEQMEGYM